MLPARQLSRSGPAEPSETFSLSLGSQLDTRTGVASCLRLWPPVSPCCVGSCEAPGRVTRLRARNTRASVELPGQDTILIREREPVRVSSPGSPGSILDCCCCHLCSLLVCPQPLPIVRCQCADIPHQLRGLSPRGHQISTSSSPHPPSLIRPHRSRDLNTALPLAPY